MSIDDKTL